MTHLDALSNHVADGRGLTTVPAAAKFLVDPIDAFVVSKLAYRLERQSLPTYPKPLINIPAMQDEDRCPSIDRTLR